jgi:hypothetical protein
VSPAEARAILAGRDGRPLRLALRPGARVEVFAADGRAETLRLHHAGSEQLVRPGDPAFLFRGAWLVVLPGLFTRPGRLMGWAVRLAMVERLETLARRKWRRKADP